MANTMTGAGDLRSKVTFSERILSADGSGNQQAEWVEKFTCGAQITPAALGGSESLDAKRLEGRAVVTIRIRSHSGARKITSDWRAVDARTGVVYGVKSAFDPELGSSQHGRWIDVLAESGTV